MPNRFLWIPLEYSKPEPDSRFPYGAIAGIYLYDLFNHTTRLYYECGSFEDAKFGAQNLAQSDAKRWTTAPPIKAAPPKLLSPPSLIKPSFTPNLPDNDLKQLAEQLIKNPNDFKQMVNQWISEGYTVGEILDRAGIPHFSPPQTATSQSDATSTKDQAQQQTQAQELGSPSADDETPGSIQSEG
ncbi:MAG TPA: hypothetical protein VGL56_15430 [Fimbriimonadaceae bacterium]